MFVNVVLLVIFLIILFCLVFSLTICFVMDRKKPSLGVCLLYICSSAAFVGGMYWLREAEIQPWEENMVSFHEIKNVSYPDDSRVQMFTCDGVHHNITSMYGKILDQNAWQIRRVRWKTVYSGIYYSDPNKSFDCYYLEQKNDPSFSIQIMKK